MSNTAAIFSHVCAESGTSAVDVIGCLKTDGRFVYDECCCVVSGKRVPGFRPATTSDVSVANSISTELVLNKAVDDTSGKIRTFVMEKW